ncbi:pre-mRNA-splicing factor ATP-dependent RNA helicase prp22 [Coniella lustricola]|uniref:Pre-mRNA-splicing factor ATP-dependent RNA helicase prp22 n=1 Tax=Coniella lustricola TaxID=2025994 RepID=A0A2T3A1Q6_9PEZI|nr:pre-mRNA-splicing factor ATP-dependent RNA helicase prp22 [Coniella lustricola]
MAKKGKDKSSAPAAAPSSSSKTSSGKAAGKKAAPPEDDLLIFTTDKKKKKDVVKEELPPEPPKPTVKQLIGGQSWTGKLPVNLLQEHCQKMKWQKPDYIQRKNNDGFSFMVVLSAKNSKTQEVTKLDPFKLPPTHVHMAYKETSLEARHFAATYALFRVCSMKNMSMVLPPDYRSIWKEFETLKKQDVKEGKAWLYEADPFKALEERAAAKATAEKKRREQQAAKEKAATLPGAAGLVLRGNAAASSGGYNPMKGWTTVPKVEMGSKTRQHLESLLRRDTIWNPHNVVMTKAAKDAIVKEFRNLGFRASHIDEAVEECKDREETLEWLLIHVPEDDLPKWALPGSYSAGVSVGATDLRREGAIKRLAESGYSIELCRKVYDDSAGDEGKAAETLQQILLRSGSDDETTGLEPAVATSEGRDQQWEEELASLEALYSEQYSRVSPDVCQIKLTDVTNGAEQNVEASVLFRKSPHYPSQLILSVAADLPSYIKLSVIKQALAYMVESLAEEEMRMFYVITWVQENINDIIERPGLLREIAAVSSTASEEKNFSVKKRSKRLTRQPNPISWVPESSSIGRWMERQKAHAYQKMLAQRQKLPAWQVREDVVDIVSDNQVTIISGETGSGKSTQSVQYILDDLYDRGYAKCANIIVTQPRRISALGLADRVSEERCTTVGQEVGYSIRGENKTSRDTKITFVTTGVLLRRLQTSGGRVEDVVSSLADVSHVVIDEVHERSLDTDFLLSILRDVLARRNDLKLILMSATLDSATFGNYFKADGLRVGFVEIAGRTFPVQDYWLDDIIEQTGFTGQSDYNSRASDRNLDDKQRVSKVIQGLGMRINYDLVLETAKAIDGELSQTQKSGGILIFLPGVAEIDRTCRLLNQVSSLYVLPLHASLETKEQRKVFAAAPPGKRKVVVSTNVAETSITIDDIVAVIDSGRVKETSFDPSNNMRKLEETWASRAACKQRRGRAGRVQAGKCYKLYTRNLEEQTMQERPDPEIRRVPLEQLCLSVRAMGNQDVGGFLSRTPTPPAAMAVEGAIKMLRRMGALDGNEMTALGHQLAMIPADLRCGKLMVYGAIFGCLDDCVTIAAILSTKSPFLSPPDKRDLAKQAKMRFAQGDGDLLTDLRAFQYWDEMVQDRVPQRQVRSFCDDSFLSYNTLSDINSTRTQYYSALTEIGLVLSSAHYASRTPKQSSTSMPLLRALTASAFSPQIARIQLPDRKFMASVSGAVELDPEAKTIKYFTQENGRVFVHPSSTLFDSQGFSGNAAFVSYFTMMSTSKIFVRDLTPFNAYTLLLFSGAIELDTLGRGLVVDGWLRLRGWARIGVLISRLRGMVDDIIAKKVENPGLDLGDNDVVRAVVKLIELDGMDA